jgi:diguanylate cyclase (GGDEF)-like protein/PAS domain S-box-containing protein
MKIASRSLVGLFLLLVVPAAGAQTGSAAAAPGAAKPPLTVVMDDNYPPYVFRDSLGALSGYLVDSWKLWEKKTGVPVRLLATDWDQAQQLMADRQAEVIDTIFRTKERERTLDFTPPYAQIPVTIYTQTGIGGITDLNKLRGFLVGVKSGDACVDKLQEAGVSSLRQYANYQALVESAIAGAVRVLCLDEPPANYLLYRAHVERDFNKAFTLYTGAMHRAVHKGDTGTLALLARGFAAFTPAEQQALHDKWMGASLDLTPYGQYFAYLVVVAALLGALLLLWVSQLRREVRQRTGQLEAERTHLQTLVKTIPDLIWLKNAEGVYLACNPVFERLFGASEAEIVGRTDYDFVGREVADAFRRHDRQAMLTGVPSRNEEWLTFADNGYRGLFETVKTPMRDGAGNLIGILGIARDITVHEQTEAELRIAAVAFESQEGMFVTDVESTILRVNRAFAEITGYTPSEAIGRTPRLFKSGRHDAAFYAAMWESIRRTGGWQGEIWDRRKGGEVRADWLTITAVTNAEGVVTHYIGAMTDITHRKAAEDEIKSLAFYDVLTGLPNRRLLLDRLQLALVSSVRSESQVALLFIDLDNFKILNDTLGHDHGDLLLQQVAQRLVACIREGDTVARLGGDEFVVLLEDLSAHAADAATQAESVGEKILAAFKLPFDLAGHEYRSSPSIGITLLSYRRESVDELLKRADLAMYQAKAAGRNTLRFYDPQMQAAVSARAALEAELHEALQAGQFILHYQGQIGSAGQLIGAEALVRWQHPARGLLLPAEFLPLAEESGLILRLGALVLETACRQLVSWAVQAETADFTLAVNVSRKQFHQPDFVEHVLAALERTGADARKLRLELTESLLLDDAEESLAKMGALKAHGVGFALDDFGSGYSSLAHLKRLPLDQLKIDQSFVRDLLTDPNAAAVAKAIVALAESLGLAVIAEGVETAAQRDGLARLGCHAYQGYLFGRPGPVDLLEAGGSH